MNLSHGGPAYERLMHHTMRTFQSEPGARVPGCLFGYGMNRRRSDLALKKDERSRAPGENQGRAARTLDGATVRSQAEARLLLHGFIPYSLRTTPTPEKPSVPRGALGFPSFGGSA